MRDIDLHVKSLNELDDDQDKFEVYVDIAKCLKRHWEVTTKTPAMADAIEFNYAYKNNKEYLQELIKESKIFRIPWDTLQLVAQYKLRKGEYLPADLRRWIAGWMAGDNDRPGLKPSEKERQKSYQKGILIDTMQILLEVGDIKPSRNDTSVHKDKMGRERGSSAADAVSIAFEVSFSTVRQAWKEFIRTVDKSK